MGTKALLVAAKSYIFLKVVSLVFTSQGFRLAFTLAEPVGC